MSDPAASPAAEAASPSPSPKPDQPVDADVIVQYVVMRSDLIKGHKWNVGGLIANGSHGEGTAADTRACVRVLLDHMNDPVTAAYVSPTAATQMHKVVLSARDEAELDSTADMLRQNQIKHVVWTEQPDNLRSCLAIKPYPRAIIQPLLRHLKLFR